MGYRVQYELSNLDQVLHTHKITSYGLLILAKLFFSLFISLILISSFITVPPANAAIPLDEIQEIHPLDIADFDRFGFSVSIEGDTAVVGKVGPIGNEGSVYVFEKVGGVWTQVAKLTASNGEAADSLGESVSISGDTIAAGAKNTDAVPNPGPGQFSFGSVYVFVKPGGGWVDATEDAELRASDGVANSQLGQRVSISGDTIIAGRSSPASAEGAAYIFEKPGGGWVDATEDAKLTASDAAAFQKLGNSVSISGDTAVAGVVGDDDQGAATGAAYVYVKPGGGWVDATEDAQLKASDAALVDNFGQGVSISGDTILVGASNGDSTVDDSGSAYIFEKPGGGWVDATEDAKLTPSDPADRDDFGRTVSISGDNALVGARAHDDSFESSGAAYYFMKPGGGWVDATEDSKLTASDAARADAFGEGVSISSNVAIVGASTSEDNCLTLPSIPCDQGSAYIFGELSPIPPMMPIGGEFIGIDTVSVLVAGTQNTAAWMIPVIVSVIGIGIVIARKF